MFYKEVKKPKVGQTIFMVGKITNESGERKTYLRQLFVKKVITTALTETPMNIVFSSGYDSDTKKYFQTQEMQREMKNHILVATRCDEIIDLSVGEKCGQEYGNEPLGKIFFNKKQAKKYFKKLKDQKCLYVFDEAHTLLSTSALNKFIDKTTV